ncbi:MAG TPA: PAS domain S-box protein [Sphingomicrobium sp.]|nr:PAS domain S-box protein [Sphingomicrobium sp.]
MRPYLAALGFVAIAAVVRLVLDPFLGDRAPFLLFLLAVLISAARFGLWPGLAAAVVSGFLSVFLFVQPKFAFLPLAGDDLSNIIAFTVITTAVLLFVARIGRLQSDVARREAKVELDVREQRLVDAAQDYAIYELDREGRILTWNKGAERLKGWKADEIIGKPYNILHTPESRAKSAPGRELKIAAQTGRFEEEAPRMRKDGTIFAAHVSLFPLRDDNGEVTGFVKVTRDISNRSKAGRAILETRRRMEAIVQSAMDAIITFDEELRIVLFNPAAQRIFGYSEDEILGKQLEILFPERMADKQRQNFRVFFKGGEANRRFDGPDVLVAVRKTGEEFPIEASMSQVTVDGERVGTVILRDITERKTNEEARALLAREVDHRAKNALAVAQALVGLTKADTVEDFADAIRGRIASLARAHSLLSQSQWRGASLEQLIRDELLPYAKEGQLLLNGQNVNCGAEAVQSLSLLFHELATNAVKHGALSSRNGHVTIEWRLENEWMRISWKEQGGPPVVAPKREGFGTKLLNQVSGRQLNARLDFDWRADGLQVKIKLPADLFTTGEISGAPDEVGDDLGGVVANGKERRILVVEDEELVALELSAELTRLGWAIVGPAATLSEAQSLLSKPFDAAVLDVNLRGRSVYPVAEALKERHVPFVFCTGYEMVDPEGRFPTVPIIRKPAQPAAISAALADLLKARAH